MVTKFTFRLHMFFWESSPHSYPYRFKFVYIRSLETSHQNSWGRPCSNTVIENNMHCQQQDLAASTSTVALVKDAKEKIPLKITRQILRCSQIEVWYVTDGLQLCHTMCAVQSLTNSCPLEDNIVADSMHKNQRYSVRVFIYQHKLKVFILFHSLIISFLLQPNTTSMLVSLVVCVCMYACTYAW